MKQQRVDAGNALFNQKKYREALVEYRKALQVDPNLGEVHRKAAEAHTALDDPGSALPEYVRAADLAPTDDALQIEAGRLFLYAGRFQDAEARARGVLRRNPTNAPAMLLLGSALAGMRRVNAAFDAEQQALTLDPRDAGSHVKMSALQFLRGNRAEALAALKQAEALDNRSASIQMALASYYWAMGQVPESEAAIKRALELEPDNALANGALAAVYLETRDADAEPILKKVVTIAKDLSSRVGSRIALSTYYLQHGRHKEAAEALEPLIADHDTLPIGKTRLALIEFDAGRQDAALAHLGDVLKEEPRYVPALAIQAQILLEKGDVAKALVSAKAAADANPNSAQGQYALGRAYLADKETTKAADAFLKTIKIDPRSTNAYLELSRLNFARGETVLAVSRAERAVALSPRSQEARLLLARALIARPETAPRAKAELARIAADYPTSPGPHLIGGALALLQKNRPVAKSEFERALALDPSSLEAVTALVSVDLEMKQLASARNRLNSFLATQPRSVEGLMLLAQTYAMEHNYAKAEESLRKVIELHPANFDAYSALGSLYLAQNKVKEARAEFIHVTEEQPRSVGAPTLVGVLSEALGDRASAEQWYKKALEIDTNAPVAANNLAWIYAEQGQNLDIAVQLATEANNQLSNAEVSDTLGWASYKADLTTTAIPLFQKSIERNPANPTYHYHLGMAYVKQRDPVRAKTSLQRALALNPSFANAADARTALASLD